MTTDDREHDGSTPREPGAPPLLVFHRDGLTVLKLNRPQQLNAIDRSMALALIAAVEDVAADDGCRCLMITGSGRAFCSGQSLGTAGGEDELPTDIYGLIRERYVPLVLALRHLPVPVVAAVNGPAVGAGFSLALAADVRVASDSAWFSCAFAQIGLVPDSGATYFLPRMVGVGLALHYALTGERIEMARALELGLVSTVFAADRFEADAEAFSHRLAEGATRALGFTKRALYAGADGTLEAELDLEARLQQQASTTDDFREGLSAFRQKRKPEFKGR
ncbi:MAG: enoyl-CoA hydratase-related protein [Candidatus Dormibacteraeota bacterium]|nr:enoyl-CoA hydratase-related protein [Candidatus Dormibacteraeota bacterium]